MKPIHLSIALLAALPAGAFADGPGRVLSANEMDNVAAGTADVSALAFGDGKFTITATKTAAQALRRAGATPNNDGYAFVSGGSAGAFSDQNSAVGVVANTNSDQPNTATIGISWSFQNGPVSMAAESSYTVGNRGTFFGP